MLKRLQKLSATASALREAHLLKEAGAAKRIGKAALKAGATAGKALGNHFEGQVKKHGPIGAILGTVGGVALAASSPVATASTYKAYKSGFNPKLHKVELGLD